MTASHGSRAGPDGTAALAVGGIVAGSFRICFAGGVVWITIVASAPFVLVIGAFDLLNGDPASVQFGSAALELLAASVCYIFAATVTMLAGYDCLHGRTLRPRVYAVAVVRRMIPLTACWFLIWICLTLAALALVVPALWLYAFWSVAMPVILIEGLGFAALGRSAELTRGYRWPVLGTLAILGACAVAISTGLEVLAGLLRDWAPASALVLEVSGSLAAAGALFVGTALIYARLQEIKEGVGTDLIADVFA